VSELAPDFIEFEKIVSAKSFRRKVFILMVELRKILIEVMHMHLTPLCPILLMRLFTSYGCIGLPESDEEVLNEARLAHLGVPKNQNPLVLFHA
jgi:hypothetical protein